ncbi:MAG: LamG domain-containing protein, partial [Verrucomicrobiota bacterium]
ENNRFFPPDPTTVLWRGAATPPGYCGGFRMGIDPGQLEMGVGLPGLVDEVGIFNSASTIQNINGRMRRRLNPANDNGLVSYWTFDNHDPSSQFVVDQVGGGDRTLDGFLFPDAVIITEPGQNAPIELSNVEVLGPIMQAYFPFDDGRWISRTEQQVEDFTQQNDYDYAGTFVPSTNEIDFVPNNNWFTNGATMAFPNNFGIPLDSPWRTDSDFDGMPDIWEVYFGFDPNQVDSVIQPNSGPLDDLDGDGLLNLFEYYANTDPTFYDSNTNGIDDALEDADGDGLSNLREQQLGSHPNNTDTDDDGFTDGEEAHVLFTSPLDSVHPIDPINLNNPDRRQRFKSLRLGAQQHRVPNPSEDRHRFNLPAWTVETWVYLNNGGASGSIFEYVGQAWSNGVSTNFTYMRLGINNARQPFVAMDTTVGQRTETTTLGTLPLNEWVHVAGTFDDLSDSLRLYVNGVLVADQQVLEDTLLTS